MGRMVRLIGGFLRDQRGTETLEWGLVCALIVVGTIATITLVGPKVKGLWEKFNDELPATP